MNATSWVAVVVAIIIIIGGVWFFVSGNSSANPADQSGAATTTGMLTGTVVPSDNSAAVDNGIGEAPKTVTVSYSESGFAPKSVTINKGDTVSFVNNSGRTMWVGADEHPTHTEYDGSSRTSHCSADYTGAKPFDQCSAGTSFSFTFDKAGSFDYHNHAAAQFTGTVVVQ